jgi:hypothetical protein
VARDAPEFRKRSITKMEVGGGTGIPVGTETGNRFFDPVV